MRLCNHQHLCRSAALVLTMAMATVAIGRSLFAAEPQRLTNNGRLKFSPVVCKGGEEIVYVELVNPTLYQLRRLVLSDGRDEPLHPQATTSEFEPAWAVDDKCYAYLKTRGALSVGIVTSESGGGATHEIPPGEGFCGFRSPAVSPGRTWLAFSYAENGTQQVYRSRLDGSDRKPLTNSTGINNWPHFSSDGQQIVFGSSRDNDFEIYRMNTDGGDVQRLTSSPNQDIRPKFSPDGTRIAFTSHRDGNAEIYVMNSDGSGVCRVTHEPERDDYADWHPDGQRLVVVCERQGKQDLFLVPVPPATSTAAR